MNNHEHIALLTEKFFQATTTLAEEEELYAYFAGEDIDESLLPLREMFVDIASMKQETLDESLPTEVWQHPRHMKSVWWAAAASVIIAVGITATLLFSPTNSYEAYIYNERTTDEAVVMNEVHATLAALGDESATNIDNELRGLFSEQD